MAEGIAEVEHHHVLEVDTKLDDQRLIESELGTKLGHVFRGGRSGLACKNVDGVAFGQLQQEEV